MWLFQGRYVETRIMRLLREFDPALAKNYIDKMSRLHQSFCGHPALTWVADPRSGQPIAFRINFDCPIFLMLSYQLSENKKLSTYRITRDEWSFQVKLAIVPVYLSTLDTITVFKLWSDAAERFFSPTAEPITREQETFWQLDPALGGAQFSSMNFVLKNKSPIDRAISERASPSFSLSIAVRSCSPLLFHMFTDLSRIASGRSIDRALRRVRAPDPSPQRERI